MDRSDQGEMGVTPSPDRRMSVTRSAVHSPSIWQSRITPVGSVFCYAHSRPGRDVRLGLRHLVRCALVRQSPNESADSNRPKEMSRDRLLQFVV